VNRQLVLGALHAELDGALVPAESQPPFPGFLPEAVEALVGVHRVVVEEDGAVRADPA
jgi:hypothetical protein